MRLVDGRTAQVVALREVAGAAEMWDLTVSQVHTFAVGDAQAVVHNCGPVKAGDAGSFGDLYGPTGDQLTAHHMPQASLAAHFGFDEKLGGAIVMDQGIHARTFSYAGKGIAVKNATIRDGLTFRQALAQAIWDYRSLVPNGNRSIRQLIDYWWTYRPDLMAK